MITFTINGRELQVEEGTTVLEAALDAGIRIPTLCYHKELSPYGACRLCLVEIADGARPGIQAACLYRVIEGLVVGQIPKGSRRREASFSSFSWHEAPTPRKSRSSQRNTA